MNIALLEPLGIPGKTIDELAAPLKAAGHEFVYFDTKTTDADELTRRSAGAEIVMIANNPYPAEVIEASDALKMIAVAFTGIDHVALDACRARGSRCATAPAIPTSPSPSSHSDSPSTCCERWSPPTAPCERARRAPA